MATKTANYTITEDDKNYTLKGILVNRLKFSVKLITKVKYHGDILVNGKHATVLTPIKCGDEITVIYPQEESYFEPQNIPIDVVYEDDDVMLINKQAGLIVHPTYNFPTGTLANAIAYYMQQKGEIYKLRFVNRLDMYTSGIIIVAKNAHAQDNITKQMQQNTVIKKYIAIVHGIITEDGTIDAPIDRDPNHKARRFVTPEGYPSVTHYKVLENIYAKDNGSIEGYSVLELKLDTGRTHQIRVHLTHIGHPIVGDELYGQLFGYDVPPEWMPRQALHSHYIEFIHPVSGEVIKAETDIPDDMKKCLEYIKAEK